MLTLLSLFLQFPIDTKNNIIDNIASQCHNSYYESKDCEQMRYLNQMFEYKKTLTGEDLQRIDTEIDMHIEYVMYLFGWRYRIDDLYYHDKQ